MPRQLVQDASPWVTHTHLSGATCSMQSMKGVNPGNGPHAAGRAPQVNAGWQVPLVWTEWHCHAEGGS